MPKAVYAAFDAIWNSLVFDVVTSLNVDVGVASETDSAFGLAEVKIRSVGFAAETDSAIKLNIGELRSIGVAVETDSAQVLAKKKIRAAGVSLETDSSLQLARTKLRTAGVSLETDASLNLAQKKLYSTGIGNETDIAIAPAVNNVSANPPAFYFPLFFNIGSRSVQLSTGYAVETDTALAVVRTKFYSVKIATTTNIALNLGVGSPGFYFPFRFYVGVPGGAKLVNTGRSEEIDTALSRQLVRSPQKVMVRWAQETPVASKVTYRRIRATGVATSVNTSPGPRVAYVRSYGIANETNTAYGPPFGIVGQVGVSVETDTAFTLVHIRAVTTKFAEEEDDALALISPTAVDVGVAVEIDTALLLETSFVRGIGSAQELDEALPCKVLHALSTNVAVSANTAERLARISVTDTKLAQSFNTSFGPTPRKIKACGTAVEVDAARGMLVRSYAAREYDNALFFEIKQNGVVIFPVVSSSVERRMWTGFIT